MDILFLVFKLNQNDQILLSHTLNTCTIILRFNILHNALNVLTCMENVIEYLIH